MPSRTLRLKRLPLSARLRAARLASERASSTSSVTERPGSRTHPLVVLRLPPSVNALYGVARHKQGARAGKPYVYKTRVSKAWAAEARWSYAEALTKAGWPRLLCGAVKVEVEVARTVRMRDLDNMLKVLLDAFQGVAYQNDAAIDELIVRRVGEVGAGMLRVRVAELAPEGGGEREKEPRAQGPG